MMRTESGLEYEIYEKGTGAMPQSGDTVSVHFTGMLEDGTVFESSYDAGEPFTFMWDRGEVLLGWDEGIGYLAEGSKARLILPPQLGYGHEGAGDLIPPNATLIFDVELLNIRPLERR